MENYRTRAVGVVFDYKGDKYEVVEGMLCKGCAFAGSTEECEDSISETGHCSILDRIDRKSVIFKKLPRKEEE